MRVLSFDIGTKNLAFCDIELSDDSEARYKLGILNVDAKKTCDVIANVVSVMDREFSSISYDTILLENQPGMKNPRAKVVQTALHTWFACREMLNIVKLCAPKCKNLFCSSLNEEAIPETYSKVKRQTVKTTRNLLGVDFFQGKCDDVSDAFIQALDHFLKVKGVSPTRENLKKIVKSYNKW